MPVKGFDLQGKKAVVIGASTNVGRAIALALAEAGVDMVVAASAAEKAQLYSIAADVAASGRSASPVLVDVTSEEDVQRLVDQAVEALGRIDILVNSLDLAFARPLVQTTGIEWAAVIAANLTGVFYALKHVGRHMLDNRGGRIINVTSALGERGLPNAAAYSTAKGGVTQLTRAAAVEWAPSGVYVNGIGLGWMEGDPLVTSNPEILDRLERFLPMHRLGRPDEVGALAVYLASDACGYITGHTIFVEGGVMSKL